MLRLSVNVCQEVLILIDHLTPCVDSCAECSWYSTSIDQSLAQKRGLNQNKCYSHTYSSFLCQCSAFGSSMPCTPLQCFLKCHMVADECWHTLQLNGLEWVARCLYSTPHFIKAFWHPEHSQDLEVGAGVVLLHPGWFDADWCFIICSIVEHITEHPMNGHLTAAGMGSQLGTGVNLLSDNAVSGCASWRAK